MFHNRLLTSQADSAAQLITPHGRNGSRPTGNAQANSSNRLDASVYAFPRWKRILDLVIILLTAVIWLPLMIVIMYGIKVIAPGPAFYRQRRIGLRGRPFLIFKFRSMKVNAETLSHEEYLERLMREDTPMTKLDASDRRLIPLGYLLRATGLDELPQIFNVLRGEMSLIGPRPCTELEFSCYQPWQKERVNAPPGITGYWQVNGKNKTTFNQMIAMDILYAKRMSVGLDLVILARTLPVLCEQTVTSFSSRWRNLRQDKNICVPATATNPVTTRPTNE